MAPGVDAGMSANETLIIADDHPLFRSALEQAALSVFPGARIISVETFEELQGVVDADGSADLMLLDLNMPGCRGYSALVYARGRQPGLPVVIVSAFEEARVIHGALEHGASGFIPKSAGMETMVAALTAIRDGEVWTPEIADVAPGADAAGFAQRLDALTPQQLRVLIMLTQGMLNKQIAIDLSISEATVKAHITAILRKLGVYTRTQAVIAARSLDIDWELAARQGLDAADV